jgi:hypothetical protein
MQSLFVRVKYLPSICFLGTVLIAGTLTQAQEPIALGAVTNHDHAPIVVKSRPVIERLPVKVIQPVDLRVGKSGRVFVVDRIAKCVFRLDLDGTVSLPLADVSGLQRIQIDSDENLYALTSNSGESQIQMVNPMGQSTVLHELTFSATSFARDSIGQFVVVSGDTDRIVLISSTGDVLELARIHQPVADVVLNAGGQTEALLKSGEVIHISADGEVTPSGFAHPDPHACWFSLMAHSSCSPVEAMIRCNWSRCLECKLARRNSSHSPRSRRELRAVGFDMLGNLCLANPELRAITKVTSHFRIPCPHCGRATEMVFHNEAEALTESVSRNF